MVAPQSSQTAQNERNCLRQHYDHISHLFYHLLTTIVLCEPYMLATQSIYTFFIFF